MPDLEKIKKFFVNDRFCLENGIVIEEVTDEYALATVEIEERHYNADKVAQGGLIFTLADFAFALHANAHGRLTVSQNATINYLKAGKCKKLFAKATPIHEGKKTVIYQVNITDENDNKIAFVTVTGYVLGENPALKDENQSI